MAERSFAKEVQQLKIGAGEEFRGEGILAVTKALLENGVGYVAGYQGAPISHLMDVLADAEDILEELGVHFEASASEAAAAATLAASVHYPIRGAATWKSTVGTNVASDALANLASGGVLGGALIIVGEDYGEGSSIMQERSHAFAMKSQIWLLDPRPNLECIVKAVRDGFELSEASNTPVMLEIRIRSCHLHGRFMARDNVRPDDVGQGSAGNRRAAPPSASFCRRLPLCMSRRRSSSAGRPPSTFIKSRKLNEFMGTMRAASASSCKAACIMASSARSQRLGLADLYGETEVPLYVLNVTYPLIDDEFLGFCKDKEAVLVVEEGQPDYLEQAFGSMLYKAGARTKLAGKGCLPMAGEYTGQVMLDGVSKFFREHAPEYLSDRSRAPNAPPVSYPELAKTVPMRPPGFCIGCPERPIFAAMKLVEKKLGPHHVGADIGCHLFSIMPPFNIGATTMGYGLGPASNSAFNVEAGKRPIAVMGDGGFWHNGLTSGIGNAVFNKHDGVILIVDNHYSAATGGQDILSSRADNKRAQHQASDRGRDEGHRRDLGQADRSHL